MPAGEALGESLLKRTLCSQPTTCLVYVAITQPSTCEMIFDILRQTTVGFFCPKIVVYLCKTFSKDTCKLLNFACLRTDDTCVEGRYWPFIPSDFSFTK